MQLAVIVLAVAFWPLQSSSAIRKLLFLSGRFLFKIALQGRIAKAQQWKNFNKCAMGCFVWRRGENANQHRGACAYARVQSCHSCHIIDVLLFSALQTHWSSIFAISPIEQTIEWTFWRRTSSAQSKAQARRSVRCTVRSMSPSFRYALTKDILNMLSLQALLNKADDMKQFGERLLKGVQQLAQPDPAARMLPTFTAVRLTHSSDDM